MIKNPLVTEEKLAEWSKNVSEGSLDPRVLAGFFNDIKLKSYSYDYLMQKELINLRQVRINVSEAYSHLIKGAFSKTFERVLEFTLREQITIPKEREKYKRSDVFMKYINMDDISSHRNLFKYNLLIMADGKVLTDYKVKAFNERVNIIFKASKFDTSIEELVIYFIPNSVITLSDDLSPLKFKGNNIDGAYFPSNHMFNKVHRYIGFWVNQKNHLGYIIPNITYDTKSEVFTINDFLPTDVTMYKLLIVGIDDLRCMNEFDEYATWIEYTNHSMPVPVDNLMIFIYKDEIYQPNKGEVTLEEHYPNFYKIHNPHGYRFRVFELYRETTQNEHIIYDNEVDKYLRVMKEDEFFTPEDNHELLKNYLPYQWNYGLLDFVDKNKSKIMDFNNTDDSNIYKLDTISGMLKKWYDAYVEHQKRTYGFLSGWYHNISKYSDDELNEKLRITTSEEVDGNEDFTFNFIEPQYLFTYVNNAMTGNANSFCFFVDGRYIVPTKIITYRGYQYVYLPKSMIKKDSIIEVERFDANIYQYTVEIPTEGSTIPFKKFLKYDTVINNIFLVNEDGEYLDNGEFDTYVVDPYLGEVKVDMNTSVFHVLKNSDKLKLIPTDKFKGGKIQICINDQTYQYQVRESGEDFIPRDNEKYVTLNLNGVITRVKRNYPQRLRIFTLDGRLITKRSYYSYKLDNYKKSPRFNIPIRCGTDEEFLVSYIGYDERLIYHKEKIPANGFIRMEGKVSRPINPAYHDIYLDGFRLTSYDIEIISPFTFVIKNLAKFDTLSNLEIYEKTHIPADYVKYEYKGESEFIMDKLLHEDEEFFKKVTEVLEDYEETGDTRDVDKICDWFYSFFNDYQLFNFMNGDLRRDLEPYHHIFDDNGRVCLNADERVQFEKSIVMTYYFNKDKSVELYAKDGELNYPNPPVKEYSSDVIRYNPYIGIPEDKYYQYGYEVPDYNRIYDMDHEFVEDTVLPKTYDADNSKVINTEYIPKTSKFDSKRDDKNTKRYIITR